MVLLEAMARMEGYYTVDTTPNRPQRNNNPLDLSWGPEAESFGATHGDPRFAVFPLPLTGWKAARSWLSVPARFFDGALVGGYLGATLTQVINRFAPPSENNTKGYAAFVSAETGIPLDAVITLDMLALPANINSGVTTA